MNPIRLFAALLVLAAAQSPWAQERVSRSALIIGISSYASPQVPQLPGVKHDIASAATIARAMGIAQERMTVLRDAQATKDAILRELDTLGDSVGEGARVLLYFSGHGSRWYEAWLGGCREGLLSHDGHLITNAEIARHTRKIAERADKIIVMIDACHSEGVNSASGVMRGGAGHLLTPKFYARDDASAQACATPSNVRTRGLMAESTRLGALSQNLVHITSSRADEASFDEPGKGGLATQGVRDCLLGRATDLDGSGAVSLAEVERCAQQFINEKLKPVRELGPHHVTVTGNRNIVPIAVSRPPSFAQPQPAAATPQPTHAPAASRATLREIEAQADPRRKIDVSLSHTSLRIGRDSLDLEVRSSHDGHLYLVLLGSDSRSFYLLFPNGLDSDNRIRSNQGLRLPRPDWRFLAGGPAGTDHLLVIVSQTPRDLATLALSPPDSAAPFTFALNDLAGRAALIDFLTGRGVTGESEGFGARLVSVQEVP